MTISKIRMNVKDCYGFDAKHKITAEDYKKVLFPVLNKYASNGKKARILIKFGKQYKGFTVAALVKDLQFGIKYLNTVDRCAIVTDRSWLSGLTNLFAVFLPYSVKSFTCNEYAIARDWLCIKVD